MSTMTESRAAQPGQPAGSRLDISGTSKVPMSRLVRVELRKMADTKAGLWLLIAIAAITVAITVVFFITADSGDRTFESFLFGTYAPQGFLLPVLGILLVTSEWSQRTGMVTFTLSPSRGMVVAAKAAAATLLGMAAIVVAVVVAALAALAAVVGGADEPWSGDAGSFVGSFVLVQLSVVLMGVGFGLLILSSAAAIVAYFVLPTVFTLLSGFWERLAEVRPWLDINAAQVPLFNGVGSVNGEQWAQMGTSTLLWVVLPIALGTLRVLRSEVK